MTGLILPQLKSLIVRPTLQTLARSSSPLLATEAAVNLVTGTALVESGAAYLRQANGGPALSLWQIEPTTHDDIAFRWLHLPAQAGLLTAVTRMVAPGALLLDELVSNLRYGAAICRLRYRMATPPLPAANDAAELCAYWKRVYNTAGGAGAVDEQHVALFAQAVAA